MARSGCVCEISRTFDGKKEVLVYNPRCTFHKGPDSGYGYDWRGIPVSRANYVFSEIAAGVLLALFLGAIIYSLLALVGVIRWPW